MKIPTMYVSSMLLLAVALATNGIAYAACGGGGNAVKARAPETQVAEASVSAPNEYAERGNVTAQNVSARRFDTAPFDRISPSLNLSASQHKDIDKSKASINSTYDSLLLDYESAQSELAKCSGRCEKQSKNLRNATQKLDDFDPNQAFADRLGRILQSDQLALYRSSIRSR